MAQRAKRARESGRQVACRQRSHFIVRCGSGDENLNWSEDRKTAATPIIPTRERQEDD